MNKSKFIVLFCFSVFLLQCEEKYTYNFDFPLPYINARLNEVFPANIFNYQRKAVRLDMPEGVIGYGASYGDGILMKVIQFKQEDAAILYFKEIVIPQFKEMPSHNRTGEIDGIWQAYGKESNGRRWLGWVNQIWVFQLSGSDEKNFDVLVRACRFVSFKK